MRKVARIGGGIGLILIGLVLALPLVPGPGVPLMAVGLVMISEDFPWAKRIVDWGKDRWVQLRNRFTRRPETGPDSGA